MFLLGYCFSSVRQIVKQIRYQNHTNLPRKMSAVDTLEKSPGITCETND